MDLRVYYQKIRTLEAELPDPFVVVVSRETTDGGKAGIKTDVPRRLAARLIVEGRADLASLEEAAQFKAERERDLKAAEEMEELTVEPRVIPRRVLKPAKKP
jgi:hypothetical protein